MDSYLLFISPAMLIVLAYFWAFYSERLRSAVKWRLPIAIMLCSIIVLAVRYSIERIKPFQRDQQRTSITESIKKLPCQISDSSMVFFNTPYYVDIMFYTPFTAYERIPVAMEIKELREQGYDIAVIMSQDLPQYVLNDPRINLINL